MPEAVTRATLKQYRHSDAVTDIIGLPRPGPLPDHRQRLAEVADTALAWLRAQAL